MPVTAKSSRNLGIDLMRAMAMFFVICLHILGQGGLVAHAEPGSGKYDCLVLLQILSSCAVDAYGITTGYLMCTRPFRLSRISKLWLTTVFWSVAVSCGFFILVPASRSLSEMVSMFLPILRGRYWFFTAYFVTMLVSPVLNVLIRNLSRRQFKLLLAALFLIFGVVPVCALGYDVMRISGGNHFSWMIVLYLVGGYVRMYCAWEEDSVRTIRYLIGFFLFALVHLLYIIAVHLVGLSNFRELFLYNGSPLIVGEAVCLFLYCRAIGSRIRSKGVCGRMIRFVTPGIYAVYVIHVHPLIFWNQGLITLLRPWDAWNTGTVVLAMLATAAAIFAGCILLDTLRQWCFRVLGIDRMTDRISDTLEKHIRSLFADR